MSDNLFKFLLVYCKEILLYSSLILGIVIVIILFFIIIYKNFLLERLKFLFNNNFILLFILLLLTFFFFLLFFFSIFSFILYWIYLIYYNMQPAKDFEDLLTLFVIYDNFNVTYIILVYIIFILSYIINLAWFYYIFIYKKEKQIIFIYIYNILFFFFFFIIFISIYLYSIETAEAMMDSNVNNSIFSFNVQQFKSYNFIPLNSLENKNLLMEAVKLKGQILTDSKEVVFCYNNKNDLYNLGVIKNLNFFKSTSAVTFIEFKSEFLNIENCKCVSLKINYNID